MKRIFCFFLTLLCLNNILDAKLLTHFEFEESLENSAGNNNGIQKGYNSGTNHIEEISMWVRSTEQASSSNDNNFIGGES